MSQTTEPSPPENLRKPHDNDAWWLLRRIWNRVNRDNEHFMGVVVGREGSGKSYTALRIADEIDPSFTADRVIFDVGELLEILRDRDHKPGDFYVLDEAGVSLGRRTWQERGQILVNQGLQLVRNHNLGLLFTLPRLGELDSQAQGRLQAFYELTDKEPEEYVRGKWKWMDPDRADQTGTIYKKFPRRRENGNVIRITSIAFSPPREGLVEPYEEAKREFQEQFYDDILSELHEEEAEAEKERRSPKDVAEQIIDGGLAKVVDTHGTTGKPYINQDLIRAEFELSHADARTAKSLVEREIDNLEEHHDA